MRLINSFVTFSATFLLLTSLSAGQFKFQCPPEELTGSCRCEAIQIQNGTALSDVTNLVCNGTEALDLASIVNSMTRHGLTLEPPVTQFIANELVIGNSVIKKIDENGLGPFKMRKLVINDEASELEQMHNNAFDTSVLTELFIKGPAKLENVDEKHNIFIMIQSMKSAEIVTLSLPKVTTIPSNAFAPDGFSSKIRRLVLSSGAIGNSTSRQAARLTKIENNAFSGLKQLEFIDLGSNCINKITSDAFANIGATKNMIVMLDNNQLTVKSFDEKSLSHFKGPTTLRLDNNQITYLQKSVFQQFLNANPKNEIDSLYNNKLDCDNPRNCWIFEKPAGNAMPYTDRIHLATCTNGESLTGHQTEVNCADAKRRENAKAEKMV